MLETAQGGGNYLTIISDGKLHQVVPEGTEGAVLREGTLKDETTYSKWERVYNAVTGIITNASIVAGKFGKSFVLVLNDGSHPTATLSLSVDSSFGEDMLKKFLSIDLSKPVRIVPYALPEANGKKGKKGITIYQDEKKIQSYFHSYDTESKISTPLHGYPEVPVAKKGKTISPDEWKMHFMSAKLFMVEYIDEHPQFGGQAPANTAEVASEVLADGDDF